MTVSSNIKDPLTWLPIHLRAHYLFWDLDLRVIFVNLFDNEIGDYQGDQDRIEVYQGGFETFDPPPP